MSFNVYVYEITFVKCALIATGDPIWTLTTTYNSMSMIKYGFTLEVNVIYFIYIFIYICFNEALSYSLFFEKL